MPVPFPAFPFMNPIRRGDHRFQTVEERRLPCVRGFWSSTYFAVVSAETCPTVPMQYDGYHITPLQNTFLNSVCVSNNTLVNVLFNVLTMAAGGPEIKICKAPGMTSNCPNTQLCDSSIDFGIVPHAVQGACAKAVCSERLPVAPCAQQACLVSTGQSQRTSPATCHRFQSMLVDAARNGSVC